MANSPSDSVEDSLVDVDNNVDTEGVSVDAVSSVSQKRTRKSTSAKPLTRVMIFEKEN